jgi:formylglycine-generating enzyme required for sulfatase activity
MNTPADQSHPSGRIAASLARTGLCLLVLAMLPAADQERGFIPVRRQAEDHIALVIGNATYTKSPLANPVNDATDVADAFGRIGFQVTLVTNANREEMLRGIEGFRGRLARARAAVFFYAGHGAQVDGSNWLIPIARTASEEINREDEVRFRAVDVDEIVTGLKKAKVPVSMIVLDACRNNPYTGNARSGVKGLAQLNAPDGSIVVYACGPGEVAADGAGRNSPFTTAFLAQLMTPGQPVETMLMQVSKQVREVTKDAQKPWRMSSMTEAFTFIPALSESEKLAAETARKQEELKQAELQAKLTEIATQARQADVAKQQQLAADRARIEADLATSKAAAAAINAQLDADLAAARQREDAEMAGARRREEAEVAAKRQELDALSARIEAMKAAQATAQSAGADADLDRLVQMVNERKAKKAELERLEREAIAARQRAEAEAAQRRAAEEAAAAERRRQAEVAAAARRMQLAAEEQEKTKEMKRIKAAEMRALKSRLENDIEKYKGIASSEEGRDLSLLAWTRLCAAYRAEGVPEGDVDALIERVLPGETMRKADLAATTAFASRDRSALEAFVRSYPWHPRCSEARLALICMPSWGSAHGQDQFGHWADVQVGSLTYRMRFVPGGSFQMGGHGAKDEQPVHEVALSSYWLGATEVTQAIWMSVMDAHRSGIRGDGHPVDNISWDDCQEFISRLERRFPGLDASLPTEAQWEFACRQTGGASERAGLRDVAWFQANSRKQSHEVGQLSPNALGCFDMQGNVWEWCHDFYDDAYYRTSPTSAPLGPQVGARHVLRGGSWIDSEKACSPTYRLEADKERRFVYGMRLAARAGAP